MNYLKFLSFSSNKTTPSFKITKIFVPNATCIHVEQIYERFDICYAHRIISKTISCCCICRWHRWHIQICFSFASSICFVQIVGVFSFRPRNFIKMILSVLQITQFHSWSVIIFFFSWERGEEGRGGGMNREISQVYFLELFYLIDEKPVFCSVVIGKLQILFLF